MKLIAICAFLLFLAFMAFVAFPPWTDYSIDNVVKAWANPARQDVPTAAITAMFELRSDIALMLILAVPAAVGALFALALGGGDRR